MLIARNTIYGAGNNGIQVWRSQAGDDGTIVTDNRIEAIDNRAGGSGQYGNAINVFRAGNVIVRGNRIDNCAFSAVRGNAASNIQIEGNSIVTCARGRDLCGVRLRGRGDRQQHGRRRRDRRLGHQFQRGRPARGRAGQLIRNLHCRRGPAGTDPGDGAGIGIAVEADTAVTGNVIENAPTAGIMLGLGQYLRDVAVTGNMVRKADIGIAVSVVPGAGTCADRQQRDRRGPRGAIVGMDGKRIVTGDLLKERRGAVSRTCRSAGNRVR